MRILDRAPLVSYDTAETAGQNARGSLKDRVAVIVPFLLLVLLTASVPSYANLPDAMHSPQGALDVAAALPGRYGLLDKGRQPAVPAAASSVKAIAGLMKQAIEVNAALPEETVPQAAPAPLSPADVALRVAARVPQFPLPAEALKSGGKLMWPTDGLIYSAFGASRGRRGHGAIDIVTKKGTPIAAAESGTVIVAASGGKLFRGYGKIVILDHGEGLHTVYAHCDKILVKMGQRVRRGEFVGTVGRTGRATTDHCHFEVRMAGKKVDPLKHLPARPEMVKATNWRSKSTPKKN